jgi:signal transduction histidine kinase/CheY-like chemotaxis protein
VGQPRSELLGKSDYDFFCKQEAELFWKNDNRVFASGEPYGGEEKYTDTQGLTHTTLTHKSMITDPTGKRVLIGVITDVTELKQARIEAEAANRAKSKFLANMSHEIRTPLNAITGFTELLCMEENDASKRKRLNIIKKSGENLLSLIDDILDFSKIEADKFEIVPARFDIVEMLEYLKKIFAEQAEAKNLMFHLNFEMKNGAAFAPNVIGDQQRISQILANLLSNAVKFTSEGGISLTYSYEEGLAIFKITDTGMGIAKEKQDLVFAPFRQAEVTTSSNFGGTGLGLAISRRLVKMMGGTLTLKSAPDIGSTFFVRLPLTNVSEQGEPHRLTAESQNQIDGEAMVARWLLPGDYGYDRPEYVRLALLDLPSQIARLRDAIRRGRQQDIKFISHAIKGATGNLNMTEIYEAASAINDESVKKNYAVMVIEYFFKNLETILAAVPEAYFKDDMVELLKRLSRKSVTSDFKILMAEDNKMNQLLIIDLLRRVNLGVVVAENGRQALDMLARDHYDLLLLDIQMPVMDGIETVARIRKDENLKNIHVIALTAHAIKGDAAKYIKAGCDDYLPKPIQFAKLYQKVGAVMRSKI